MKITKSQLAEAIKKEVSRLHKINIMETRLKDLNRELRLLKEGSILLEENYDADSIGAEIDDWIDANDNNMSKNSLVNKVEELLGMDSGITATVDTEEDSGGRMYGENWNKNLITIKVNGQDFVKVWTSATNRYDFGKNSMAFSGLPGDKIVSAPYGGGARFYFDKSVLNNTDNASPAEAPRQKRPRVSRPSGGDAPIWQGGL